VALVLTYGIVFVVGPGLVFWMLRRDADMMAVRNLGLGTAGLVLLALASQFAGVPGLFTAAGFWLAWVVSMALMAQVLRLMLDDPGAKRWTAAVAAIGATIPWFGMLIARSMAG